MTEKRTPVSLSDDDRAVIRSAMDRHGIRSISDFMRFAALYVARMEANNGHS